MSKHKEFKFISISPNLNFFKNHIYQISNLLWDLAIQYYFHLLTKVESSASSENLSESQQHSVSAYQTLLKFFFLVSFHGRLIFDLLLSTKDNWMVLGLQHFEVHLYVSAPLLGFGWSWVSLCCSDAGTHSRSKSFLGALWPHIFSKIAWTTVGIDSLQNVLLESYKHGTSTWHH